jgi:hypothetical protein
VFSPPLPSTKREKAPNTHTQVLLYKTYIVLFFFFFFF